MGLRLWHLPLRNFRAHLPSAQRPAVSSQPIGMPGVGAPSAWGMWQGAWSLGQPVVPYSGLHTGAPAWILTHMKSYAVVVRLPPLRKEAPAQNVAHVGGGGEAGGSEGGIVGGDIGGSPGGADGGGSPGGADGDGETCAKATGEATIRRKTARMVGWFGALCTDCKRTRRKCRSRGALCAHRKITTFPHP